MVQCKIFNSIQFFHNSYVWTFVRSFLLSTILFCVYHCAVRLTPKLPENSWMYMPRASFKVKADSPNLAHWTKRDSKETKRKIKCFWKRNWRRTFSHRLGKKNAQAELECSEPKQNARIQKNGHSWLNYFELNTTLYAMH